MKRNPGIILTQSKPTNRPATQRAYFGPPAPFPLEVDIDAEAWPLKLGVQLLEGEGLRRKEIGPKLYAKFASGEGGPLPGLRFARRRKMDLMRGSDALVVLYRSLARTI